MESSSEECVNAGLGEGRGIVIPESFCCIHSNTYKEIIPTSVSEMKKMRTIMTKPYGKGREGLLMLCSVYLIFAVAISWIIKGHRRTERSLGGQDLQCGVLSRMLACWPLCLQASRMRWIELLAPKLR